MNRHALVVLLAAGVACGGSGGKSTGDARTINVVDARADAALDASPDAGVDAGPSTTCNVLANTGCQANEKCTWVIDLWTGADATGHVSCAPIGSRTLDQTCIIGTGGAMPTGSDNCSSGLYCNSGVCKPVCDPAGGAPLCGNNFACMTHRNNFANAGEMAVAGICDPTCDPLRNTVDGTGEANCKGILNTTITDVPGLPNGYPSRGCYGLWLGSGKSRWTCANSGAKEGIQDYPLPAPIFINSCAPGFYSGLVMGSGSVQAICSAHCNPADTYMGHAANQGGLKIAGVASTCGDRLAAGKDCTFGWFFEVDDNGQLIEDKYGNLGVCMDWTRYTSATTMLPLKKCNMLRQNADPALDEAFNQGCRPQSAHPLPASPGFSGNMRRMFRPAFPMVLVNN